MDEDKRDLATQAATELRGELLNTELMLKAIEEARVQVSSTADELLHRVDQIRRRVHAHRLELDKLTRLLKRP